MMLAWKLLCIIWRRNIRACICTFCALRNCCFLLLCTLWRWCTRICIWWCITLLEPHPANIHTTSAIIAIILKYLSCFLFPIRTITVTQLNLAAIHACNASISYTIIFFTQQAYFSLQNLLWNLGSRNAAFKWTASFWWNICPDNIGNSKSNH